ncbi:hypothetical protein GCM10010260_67590 [Streptomyces filipinensis]|uniref:TrbL/VirB6 plasmid conjugal transfer protein n=1 Tax=Streptomyces filipinensis TaxID=66887 RepID=A0A918MF85_9ACTN|nr:hypothetical protein [Streptomyces filipinensis]GGV18287.1 hypothetical protein GCM10010260_67590 [Streptomyces filipinensis]
MAGCHSITGCIGDVITKPIEAGGQAVAGGAVKAFADAIGTATSETLQALNGVWMDITVGDPSNSSTNIHDVTSWLVGYVAVASLLIAAIKMALDRKGQPMKQAFTGMWKVLLVGGLAVPVVRALTDASDAYARDIYAKSDLGERADRILGVANLSAPGLILIFGLLVMLSSFVQICLMYIRIGVLIMLVGTLPLAAVSSMTGWGEGWWKKHIGWLSAWVLYKPAAALIIYSATALTHSADEQKNNPGHLNQTIAGMGMLILSVFALPALLKLIVPATAALGSTSGGTVTLNAVNNLASGAVSIASGGMGGGAGSPGPKGSPSEGGAAPAPAPTAGGGAGAGGSAGAAGGAAAGAATGGATVAVQAAAVVAQTTVAAASEVVNSLDDNDGMKGHNQ